MTDQITADEFRTAAKVLRAHGARDLGRCAALMNEYEQRADRLDREAARDAEAEELGHVLWTIAWSAHSELTDAGLSYEWEELPESKRVAYRNGANTVFEFLADRLAPAGGMVLRADEVADVRRLVQLDSKRPLAINAAQSRLRVRFAPAEKPAPQEWPSLDQVPHDVMVRREDDGFSAMWGVSVCSDEPMWRWQHNSVPVPGCYHSDTWTEQVSA